MLGGAPGQKKLFSNFELACLAPGRKISHLVVDNGFSIKAPECSPELGTSPV
jgi:hypothetical protein